MSFCAPPRAKSSRRHLDQSIVSVFVCVSVREHISGTTCPVFINVMHVTDGPGSVLL